MERCKCQFLSVFYYLTITDCRTKIVFEKETIRGYLKSLWSYAIMPIGKTIESAHMAQQNPHEVRTRGGFYAVLGGWIKPKVATSHSCPTICRCSRQLHSPGQKV